MKKLQTHRRSTGTALIIAMCLAMTPGCIWAPELSRVAKELESQIPNASFEEEFTLSLGPIAIALARLVVGFVPDEGARMARRYLGDVSRVQVAVYNNESKRADVTNVRMPDKLRELTSEGWETIVRVRDAGECVWVMCRVEQDSIRELYVVVLDSSELVIVKARGHLERMVGRALVQAHGEAGKSFGRGLVDKFRDSHDHGQGDHESGLLETDDEEEATSSADIQGAPPRATPAHPQPCHSTPSAL